jgi:uncharacterized protein
MKTLRWLGIIGLAVAAFVVYRALRQETPVTTPQSGAKRSISPDLLAILADPGDKGPIELISDADGKEWLVNRRNGYRYPVEDGIPIMLLEEGEKHRDPSIITG